MIICSLTITAPYYDCSESWTLYLYDSYPKTSCAGLLSCAKNYPPSIYYPVYQPQVWMDFCGLSMLEHELNHLKYGDKNYCHADSPQAIYDINGNLKQIKVIVNIHLEPNIQVRVNHDMKPKQIVRVRTTKKPIEEKRVKFPLKPDQYIRVKKEPIVHWLYIEIF